MSNRKLNTKPKDYYTMMSRCNKQQNQEDIDKLFKHSLTQKWCMNYGYKPATGHCVWQNKQKPIKVFKYKCIYFCCKMNSPNCVW